MGMKFRKSIKLGGGTRLNLSKSGIGVSTGVKGFRVSKNASGRSRVTASLPGTGLSYTKEYGSSGSFGNSQATPVRHSHSYGGSSAPSGGGPEKKDKPPFFQRTGVIILLLIFFAPVGIFLLWRYMPQWKTGMKVALSILFGLVFICALIPQSGDNTADVDQPPAIQQQASGTKTPARIQEPAADKQEAAQKPQDAAETAIGTQEAETDDTAAQEPAQEPQDTPQTVTQPEAPKQEQDQPKQEQPKQEQPVQQEEFKDEDSIVYITPDGKKYHKKGCRTLKVEPTEININDAIAQGRTACKVCGG